MCEQLRQHRTALLVIVAAAVILSLAGVAAGDVELALTPWALPTAVVVGDATDESVLCDKNMRSLLLLADSGRVVV